MSVPLTSLVLPVLLGLAQTANPSSNPASSSPSTSTSPDPVSGATSTTGAAGTAKAGTLGASQTQSSGVTDASRNTTPAAGSEAAQVPGGSQVPTSPGTRPGDQNRGTLPGTGTPATNPSTTGAGVDTAVTTQAAQGTAAAASAPMPTWDENRCPVDGKSVRRWRGFKATLNGRDYYTDSRRCADLLQASPETYLESNGVPKNATNVKIPSGSDTAPGAAQPAPDPGRTPNPATNSTTPSSPQPDGAGGGTVPPTASR